MHLNVRLNIMAAMEDQMMMERTMTTTFPQPVIKDPSLEIRTVTDIYFPTTFCCLPLRTSLHLISFLFLISGLVDAIIHFAISQNLAFLEHAMLAFPTGACLSLTISLLVEIAATCFNKTAMCLGIFSSLAYVVYSVVRGGLLIHRFHRTSLSKHFVDNREDLTGKGWKNGSEFIEKGMSAVDILFVVDYYRIVLLLCTIYILFDFSWRLNFRPLTLELHEPAW